ncbi:hypothetical protein GmHk_15G044900 [Glycine max]|nr:hypothetical protein GmHk_15G044900 [Glycine max]
MSCKKNDLREQNMYNIFNICDFRLLDDSYIMILHAVTLHSKSLLVRNLHWSEPLVESMTNPTNQHKTFQCVFPSLTHFMGNFPEGHLSHNYSKSSTLNYEVLI